jgi:hypothetical protein
MTILTKEKEINTCMDVPKPAKEYVAREEGECGGGGKEEKRNKHVHITSYITQTINKTKPP